MAESGRRTLTSTIALAALAMTVVIGFGASMAFAADPSTGVTNPSTLTCSPTSVRVNQAACKLKFTDEHEPAGYAGGRRANQRVCFSTKAPNVVFGAHGKCSLTNKYGVAWGSFKGKVVGAAKVYASEATEGGVSEGKVVRTVNVTH